jgi:predicted nuclease of predicted toxin-antitoxin system
MTFYLDEDVDIALSDFLHAQGHDVETTLGAGKRGAEDDAQLEYAAKQNAILITHNRRHFRRLHKDWIESNKYHAGIILTRHLPLNELERRMQAFLMFAFGQNISGMLFDLRDFV